MTRSSRLCKAHSTGMNADSGSIPTILVADSEVLVRHEIAHYLRHCGYMVIEAADSDEALTVLNDPNLTIDVFLCDAKIKGGANAFQVRTWLKENRPDVNCILAGNIEGVARAAAEICEQGPQLARPYDPQGVVDFIKQLLAGRDRAA